MKAEATLEPSVNETKFERVLVVLSPDLVKPGTPMQSMLITSALALAKATAASSSSFMLSR